MLNKTTSRRHDKSWGVTKYSNCRINLSLRNPFLRIKSPLGNFKVSETTIVQSLEKYHSTSNEAKKSIIMVLHKGSIGTSRFDTFKMCFR